MIRTKLITIPREKIIVARTLLVRVSIKVIKYPDQKHEKGLFHFQLILPITEVSQDRDSKQESGSMNWSRSQGGILLTGLRSMACLDYIFTARRTTCPQVTEPKVDWALSHKSLIINAPTDLPLVPSHADVFLVKILFFSDMSRFVPI